MINEISEMVNNKYAELQETGRVKFYENEGFNLENLADKFEIMFDPEEYSITIHGSTEGKYIQIVDMRF